MIKRKFGFFSLFIIIINEKTTTTTTTLNYTQQLSSDRDKFITHLLTIMILIVFNIRLCLKFAFLLSFFFVKKSFFIFTYPLCLSNFKNFLRWKSLRVTFKKNLRFFFYNSKKNFFFVLYL